MFRVWLMIALVGLIAVAPAAAQTDECDGTDSYVLQAAEVTSVVRVMNDLVAQIEAVPPGEAEYLRKEVAAAIKQENRQRYRMVASRPYHYPSRAHDAWAEIQTPLAGFWKLPTKVDRVGVLIAAIAKWQDFAAVMHEYLSWDANRSPPVIDAAKRGEIYFHMPLQKGRVVALAQCILRTLKEP